MRNKNLQLDDDLGMVRGPYRTKPIEVRLTEGRQIVESGCWEWRRKRNQYGYGRIYWQGREWFVHRLVLLLGGVEIPDGMTVDHLCRNKACCNPEHLEVVTNAENVRRANHKDHCIRGHELPTVPTGGRRRCGECTKITKRERYRAAHPDVGLWNANKTHCKHGHEFTPENTYEYRNGKGWRQRQCRACVQARRRAARAATPSAPEPEPGPSVASEAAVSVADGRQG